MTQKNKLWQTGSGLHPLVEQFTVGEDYILDQKLLPYDIQASKAHANMLQKIGVLTNEENTQVQQGLDEILELWKKGEFTITIDQEDGHTAIEQYLTENVGEVGKKIHTGRSRNDQSMVMIRLFSKEKLQEIIQFTENLIQVFEEKKLKVNAPLPGYTHMQKAMPTTVSTWLESFQNGFEDSLTTLKATLDQINQNPLGSAAGFGINHLELDKDSTTKEMNFDRVQSNPLYCGLSRGYFENIILQSLSQLMILSSRFASDLMLFTMQETQFFSLSDDYVTGSSIMPQKKNYDLFEIMRGNVRVFLGFQQQIQGVIAGLGSGYHRDLQLTKKPFVEGVELCELTLQLLIEVIPNLEANKENLEAAMTEELFVTDKVYEKVAAGQPFREAYLETKKEFFKK